MRTGSEVHFDGDVTAFLESACVTIVGLVLDGGQPFASRGWGTKVRPGGVEGRLRLNLPAGSMAAAGRRPGDSNRFPIALTGCDIRTLRSVQAKGVAFAIEEPDGDDLARFHAYRDEVMATVADTDGDDLFLEARWAPLDIVTVTVDVTELYDQTPGPGAGSPLR